MQVKADLLHEISCHTCSQ